MKKFLKIICVIILIPVILFCGSIIFLKFADLNRYKPKIEEMAYKYTGMSVKIKGDIDIGVSLKPSLELNEVTISKDEKNIAYIGSALVQISVIPLLNKEIVVDKVKAENTEIFYGEKDSVLLNHLNAGMDSADSPVNVEFDTTVANINITGEGNLSSLKEMRAADYNKTDVKAVINTMGYTLDFDGNVDNIKEKVKVSGKYELSYKSNKIIGNISVDTAGDKPYIKLNADCSSFNLTDFTENKQAALSNGWFIKSAAAAEYIPNTQIPYDYLRMVDADITLDVKKIVVDKDIVLTNLKGDASVKNGVFKANIKNVVFKNNTISGNAEITSPKALPYIKLNISGEGFDLPELQKKNNTVKTDKKAQLIDLFISTANASELMANTRIPYEYLKKANADINTDFKNIKINDDITLNNIKANINLKNGALSIKIKNITAGAGTVSGTISLNAAQKSLSTDLSGKDIILQQLYKSLNSKNNDVFIESGGKSQLLLKINTTGENTDQYLSNLNGQIIALTDKSVLQIKSLEKLQGNILVQLLNMVKINVSNKNMKMKCAVVRGDISGGIVKFPKGIAFDATDFYMVADGKINLQNDKINMELQPFSGKITDVNISSVLGGLVKVSGTIKNPKLGINQTATAKNVIGIIASGGAYNVGDMMLSADSSPCHTALAGTSYADYFPENKSAVGAVSKGYNNTKDSIKDLGKGVKNQVKDIKSQLKGLFK